MATAAQVSKTTRISIKIGAGGYTVISELKDFSGIGSGSAAIIDATHTDSGSKEKLTGVVDEGSYKLTFNYIAADPGQLLVQSARAAPPNLAQFKITLSSGPILSFSAWVMTAEITGGVDKVLELSTTLEVSGPVTVS